MDLKLEKNLWRQGYEAVIGLDEAGRGALAGPVCAAALMIKRPTANFNDAHFFKILKLVRDSKKLTPKKREAIFQMIKKCPFIEYQYYFVSEKIIDRINISRATEEAMKKSLLKIISNKPKAKIMLLVDGNKKIPKLKFKQKAIIKGDDKIFSVAAASIIAKVKRDQRMKKIAQQFSRYQFEIHKGYPTKKHLALIKKYGLCPVHRKTYRPLKNYSVAL